MLVNKIFIALFYVAFVQFSVVLGREANNSAGADCQIWIKSIRDEPMAEDKLKKLNNTAQRCRSESALDFNYIRIGKNEPGGERLNDLSEHLNLLLLSQSKMARISIQIVEAAGISVDLVLPHLQSETEPTIRFFLSHFRLLHKNGSKVADCSSGLSETSLFGTERHIVLGLERKIKYDANTCQQIFNKALIYELKITDVIDSMVKRNVLTFAPTNQTLNCSVDSFVLMGYEIKLNSLLVPQAIFAKTRILYIFGIVDSFEASTLEHVTVSFIFLAISRFKRLFHNNPNWLDKANQRATDKALMVDIKGSATNNPVYSFEAHIDYLSELESKRENPFEDSSFCIFYRIEQKSLNVKFFGIMIEKLAQSNCTCLLFWLFNRHWSQTDFSAYYYSDLGLCERDRAKLKVRCDFEKMAQRCSIETVEHLNYRTFYDTILDLELFKYLADVWLVPVTSLVGIISNYLVIRTFRRIQRSPEYRRNKLTDKSRFMWDYTYYNSWFILLHGLLFAFTPLTTCIEVDGIYCSSFISTSLYRPFYLFVESYLGNTFRLAANMSSTLFVLYRFSLNADRFKRFRELKPKVSLLGIIFFSLTISVVTLFGNEKFSVLELSDEFSNYLLETEIPVLLAGVLVKVAYFANKLAGTTLFTLLNMFIDLRLLYILRTKNSQRPKEEAENRITKMIIINGLFSFLFRLPEMISVCLLIAFYFDQFYFPTCLLTDQRYHSVCPMLLSISRLLLTISYLENLVLLYLFNPGFRKSFSLASLQS
nr:G protein-coupled receptor [Proales similis]